MAGRVTGIGGVFFRARDPEALARWYQTHLGIPIGTETAEDPEWQAEAGPMVFAPFDGTDGPYPKNRDFLITLRVEGLDALIARLEAAGILPSRHETQNGVGRFVWIHDPEGNPIELWEPKGPAQS